MSNSRFRMGLWGGLRCGALTVLLGACAGCTGLDSSTLRVMLGLEAPDAPDAPDAPQEDVPQDDLFRDDPPTIPQRGAQKDLPHPKPDPRPQEPERDPPEEHLRDRGAAVPRSPEDVAALGEECRGGRRSGSFCLGMKYAIYARAELEIEEALERALRNLEGVNERWSACGIRFQIDRFQWVDPRRHRLPRRTANSSELDRIRARLADDDTLLVVTTGPWDRRGTLGATGADAWTRLPGGLTHGAVLDGNALDASGLIAHELGHYLGLGHAGSASRLMHPVIYSDSERLTARECARARLSARRDWGAMLRE